MPLFYSFLWIHPVDLLFLFESIFQALFCSIANTVFENLNIFKTICAFRSLMLMSSLTLVFRFWLKWSQTSPYYLKKHNYKKAWFVCTVLFCLGPYCVHWASITNPSLPNIISNTADSPFPHLFSFKKAI